VIGWSDPRQQIGELLWPERFGKTEIDELKRALEAMRQPDSCSSVPRPLRAV